MSPDMNVHAFQHGWQSNWSSRYWLALTSLFSDNKEHCKVSHAQLVTVEDAHSGKVFVLAATTTFNNQMNHSECTLVICMYVCMLYSNSLLHTEFQVFTVSSCHHCYKKEKYQIRSDLQNKLRCHKSLTLKSDVR